MLESALFNSIPLCTLDVEIDVTMRVSAISVANFDTLLARNSIRGRGLPERKNLPPMLVFIGVGVDSRLLVRYPPHQSSESYFSYNHISLHKYLKLTGVQTCIRESRTSNKYVTKFTLSLLFDIAESRFSHCFLREGMEHN